MAVQLEKILGNHIQQGVLSIPHGFQKHSLTSKFEVYEGAIDNIPDADAVKATQKIKNLMISLSKDDILIVLISGKRFEFIALCKLTYLVIRGRFCFTCFAYRRFDS